MAHRQLEVRVHRPDGGGVDGPVSAGPGAALVLERVAVREELGAERLELLEAHLGVAHAPTAPAAASLDLLVRDLVERIRDRGLGGGPSADLVDRLQLDHLGELHGLGDGDVVLLRDDPHVRVQVAETSDATVHEHLVQ